MSTTTPNMSLTVPVAGDTTPGYVDAITASLNAVDAHDHSTGKGVAVRASTLNWNTTVDTNGQAVTNLKTTRYADQASLPAAANPRALYTVAGDLWFNNGTSSAIKLTSGAGFNAAIVGGIAGTYASSGAQLVYATGSPGTYTFQNAAAQNANIVAAGLQLTASPFAVTTPSTTKTFRVSPLRGFWPNTGVQPTFPNPPLRVTFPASSTGRWFVALPAPNFGTISAVRIRMYGSGTAVSGSCAVNLTSNTSGATGNTNVGNATWPAAPAGDFTLTINPTDGVCAGRFFWVDFIATQGASSAAVAIVAIEFDVLLTQIPDTLV